MAPVGGMGGIAASAAPAAGAVVGTREEGSCGVISGNIWWGGVAHS